MTPTILLVSLVVITLVAVIAQAVRTGARRSRLARLARDWKMHFCPGDRFKIADRVGGNLPVIGVGDVRVSDLIYGNEGDFYRFVFNVQFTMGVVRWKKRVWRIATCRESKSHASRREWTDFRLAPEGARVLEQYEALKPVALAQ